MDLGKFLHKHQIFSGKTKKLKSRDIEYYHDDDEVLTSVEFESAVDKSDDGAIDKEKPKLALKVQFSLGVSSYATMMLREIIRLTEYDIEETIK